MWGLRCPLSHLRDSAGGAQSGGTSLFTNTVSNQSSGVTLSILAHVNSSQAHRHHDHRPTGQRAGSAPRPARPSSRPRSPTAPWSTQVTVQDGDTIAIGGAILENHAESTGGVPFLSRIPILGPIFGAKSLSVQRTEPIIFLTPRVIYDTPTKLPTLPKQASRGNLKRVGKSNEGRQVAVLIGSQ